MDTILSVIQHSRQAVVAGRLRGDGSFLICSSDRASQRRADDVAARGDCSQTQTALASISTSEPSGSADTATVVRAGLTGPKNRS
jgi:hypothetical protein